MYTWRAYEGKKGGRAVIILSSVFVRCLPAVLGGSRPCSGASGSRSRCAVAFVVVGCVAEEARYV